MRCKLSTQWPVIACALVAAFACASRLTRAAVFNVSDYGAYPNDEFDDSASINDAIAAAAASPGSTVVMSPGTYYVASQLIAKSNVSLKGDTAADTVLYRTGNSTTPLMNVQNVTNVDLSNFTLDGSNLTKPTDGIYAASSSNLNLHDLAVQNIGTNTGFGPHGIIFNNDVTNSIIKNNTLSNIGPTGVWGAGIRMAFGSSDNQVSGNVISNTGRGGILCDDNSTGLTITSNTISGSGGVGLGVELQAGCSNSVVGNNTMDHWLSVDGSDNVSVRGNTISDHSGIYKYAGLELVDAKNVVFTDNTVDGGATIGISISGSQPKQNIYWGHNTIRGASTWGAQIQGESGGAFNQVFYKNVFNGTLKNSPATTSPPQGHGIRINANAWNITFANNDVSGNQGDGLQIISDNVHDLSFTNNTIAANAGRSVNITTIPGLLWYDNVVVNNGTNNQLTSIKPRPSDAMPTQPHGSIQVGQSLRFGFDPTEDDEPFAHVLWDFGRGIPSTDLEPTMTYTAAGDYVITMIGWDAAGTPSMMQQPIHVDVPEPAGALTIAMVVVSAMTRRRRRCLRLIDATSARH